MIFLPIVGQSVFCMSFEKLAIRGKSESKRKIVLWEFQNGSFSVAIRAATSPLPDLLICKYFYHPFL